MSENNHLIRLLVLIVAIVLLLPVLMMIFALPMMGMWGGGHMWNGTGASWMWLVMWVIPILILLGGGYPLYRAFASAETEETDAALEELRIAYARGDISEDEFENRRERLRRENET